MDHVAPVAGSRVLIAATMIGDIGLVDEGACPILLGHPDQDGSGIGDVAEPAFTLAQGRLGAFGSGDIDQHGYEADHFT